MEVNETGDGAEDNVGQTETQGQKFLRVTGLGGVVDAVTLRDRIREYIEYRDEQFSACKLSTLNRKFGMYAVKYGVELRHLLGDLEAAGHIFFKEFGTSTVVIHRNTWEALARRAPDKQELAWKVVKDSAV